MGTKKKNQAGVLELSQIPDDLDKLTEYQKCCGTCEFNFGAICAGGDGSLNAYGADIISLEHYCAGYGISFEAFCKFQ